MSHAGRRLSLPHEHGALLTLAGAVVVGLALARAEGRWAAGGLALCLCVALVARGPLDAMAVGRAARYDRVALALLGVVAVAGAVLAWRAGAVFGFCGAAAVMVAGAGSAMARRARLHRHPWFEAAAMAALGAGALPIALAGGAPAGEALPAALVLALHAALAVPLVRSELRPRERSGGRRADAVALIVLVAAAAGLTAWGRPMVAVALVPRAAQVGLRAALPSVPRSPTWVGVRETALLALCALLAAVAR